MEFRKVLIMNEEAMQALLESCNLRWQVQSVPEEWTHATVITLFKKGDTSLPSNYRPTSLLNVGYKVLAALLLGRLQTRGAEERIQAFQFDFRKNGGTSDALFVARRIIDAAVDDKDGELYMILRDGRLETFRSARTDGTNDRWDLLTPDLHCERQPSAHDQRAGTGQGCHLSP